VDIYALDPAGTLYRATSIAGAPPVGWVPVPGATNVTHFDVVRLSANTALIAAAWSGGTTTFLHNLDTNAASFAYVDAATSVQLTLAPELVEGRARLLTRRATGAVQAKTVFAAGALASGAFSTWSSSVAPAPVVVVPWQRAVSVAVAVRDWDGAGVFRTIDGLYPNF
jgi:hypothetical protein